MKEGSSKQEIISKTSNDYKQLHMPNKLRMQRPRSKQSSCRENELDKYRPITIAITILNWVEFDKLEQTNIQRGR